MKNYKPITASPEIGRTYDEKWMRHGLPHEVNERESVFENLDVKDKLLLDLGAGTLRFSLAAIQKGAKQVVAVEMLREMLTWGLAKVREIGEQEKANVIVADVRYLPFLDNAFDVAIAIELFEHIPTNVDLFVKEMQRVLRKSGKAAINTWNAIPRKIISQFGLTTKELEYWSGDFYYRYYYPWEFKRLIRLAGFSRMKVLGVHSTYLLPYFGIRESTKHEPKSRLPVWPFFIEIAVDKLCRKIRPLNQVTGQFLLAILQK